MNWQSVTDGDIWFHLDLKARRIMKQTGWELAPYWERKAEGDFEKAAWILDQMTPGSK